MKDIYYRKTRSKRQEGGDSKNTTYNEANKKLLQAANELEKDNIEDALKDGADINVKREEDGNTALIMAIEDGDIKIVDFLLKSGADIYIKNKLGQNAIDRAKTFDRNKYVYEKDDDEKSYGPILTLLNKQDKLNKHLREHNRRQMERDNFSKAVKGRIPKELLIEGMEFLGGKNKTKKKIYNKSRRNYLKKITSYPVYKDLKTKNKTKKCYKKCKNVPSGKCATGCQPSWNGKRSMPDSRNWCTCNLNKSKCKYHICK